MLNRLRSRLCSRAVSNGRSEWAQACWQNNVQGGVTRLPGPAICMGIASLGTLWPNSSRVRPGSLLPMLFELEVLLTWARELRLEYEVGS